MTLRRWLSRRGSGRIRGEGAQAMVELALIAPLNIFMLLGILQLGLAQHAQLLTEYAAFCAARAGIVHHGNPNAMKEAAFLALQPTFARVFDSNKPNQTLIRTIGRLAAYQQMGMKAYLGAEAAKWEDFGKANRTLGEAVAVLAAHSDFDFIRIETVPNGGSGRYGTLGRNVRSGHPSQEIDFDDVSSIQAIEANVLSIRLTYYYVMRIPFANWVIHNVWAAGVANTKLLLSEITGARRTTELQEAYFVNAGGARLTAELAALGGEMRVLAFLARAGVYAIPIRATHAMRMQSNQFQKFMP